MPGRRRLDEAFIRRLSALAAKQASCSVWTFVLYTGAVAVVTPRSGERSRVFSALLKFKWVAGHEG
jgi:hypothetical protein